MCIVVKEENLTLTMKGGYQDSKAIMLSLLNVLRIPEKDLSFNDIDQICRLIQEMLPSDSDMETLDKIALGWSELVDVKKD